MTACTNRSKADQGPREWMLPLPEAHCRYVSAWVATRLRWNLVATRARPTP
ncbi:hypothetical protein ABTY59_35950 [Streptomyces sp. NPDC096079]|uniref:hypothetical protein n=1 Tax=Streptomyces sp. NPDC096079 TaxID=3155820 RepID=UPI003326F93B